MGTPECSTVITIVTCLGLWTLAQICHLIWLRFKRWPHRQRHWEKARSTRRQNYKEAKLGEKDAKARYHYNRKEQLKCDLRENRKRRLYSNLVNKHVKARKRREYATSNYVNNAHPYQPSRNWQTQIPLEENRTGPVPVQMPYQPIGTSQMYAPSRPQPVALPQPHNHAPVRTREDASMDPRHGFNNGDSFSILPGAIRVPGPNGWRPQETTLTAPPQVVLPMAIPTPHWPSTEMSALPSVPRQIIPRRSGPLSSLADDSTSAPDPLRPPRPPQPYLPQPPTNIEMPPPALPQLPDVEAPPPPTTGPPAQISRNPDIQRRPSTVSALSRDEYPVALDYNISPMNSVRRPNPNDCVAIVPISTARPPQPSASHSVAQCRSPGIEVCSIRESGLDQFSPLAHGPMAEVEEVD